MPSDNAWAAIRSPTGTLHIWGGTGDPAERWRNYGKCPGMGGELGCGSGFRIVAANRGSICALHGGGYIKCHGGRHGYGRVGGVFSPVSPSGLPFVSLHASSMAMAALSSAGEVIAWGNPLRGGTCTRTSPPGYWWACRAPPQGTGWVKSECSPFYSRSVFRFLTSRSPMVHLSLVSQARI